MRISSNIHTITASPPPPIKPKIQILSAADARLLSSIEERDKIFEQIKEAANNGLYSIIIPDISDKLFKELIELDYKVEYHIGCTTNDMVKVDWS